MTACERAGILAHGTALTSLQSWSPAAQQHFDGVARLLAQTGHFSFVNNLSERTWASIINPDERLGLSKMRVI
ncbi:MAG: hypothetical protein M3N91_09785 [Pseudomonadota bacterium]|nr:hypothetical protein [Pseudomonadota bacterium]